MSLARIYRPAKSAMQSGKGRTRRWVLEFVPSSAKTPDNLMGWITSDDMMSDEVRIRFGSKEEAVRFAERAGIEFEVKEKKERALKPKSYADKYFKFQAFAYFTKRVKA